jgi:membrane-associated phospholipid phosphatase
VVSLPDAANPTQPPQTQTGAEEETSVEETPYWRTNFFSRFFKDQAYLFKTWIPSEARNPAFAIPFTTVTALAISSSRDEDGGPDAQLEQGISENSRNSTTQGFARFLSAVGDASGGVVLIGAGYLIGRLSGHDKLAEASSLSAEALLSAGLWSTVLKGAFARTRPSGSGTGTFFDYHPGPGQTPGSFPSGHATGAFTVATVFSGVYAEHKWVPYVAYGAAGLVGLSRLALTRHFPTDVMAGALLGNSMGRMVLSRQGESNRRQSYLGPVMGEQKGDFGFAWNYSW